jgi:hypothetical protein
LRATAVIATDLAPFTEVGLTVVDAPTRRDLALAFARALRDPADRLLRGDRASVAEYLGFASQ